ncbi:hypothetical protein [Fusobacterium vincentii]|uniref:hypothetical protein n=1 Tax=Fusobacterium vincentii TaxID=155615 RepID=UPI0030CF241F
MGRGKWVVEFVVVRGVGVIWDPQTLYFLSVLKYKCYNKYFFYLRTKNIITKTSKIKVNKIFDIVI